MSDIEKVNIREFRNNMAKYAYADSPFAVMKHGHTVGYYIPVPREPAEEDYKTLHRAAETFDKFMQDSGLSEDVLMEELKELRQRPLPQ